MSLEEELLELEKHHKDGCLFFTFVEQDSGICIHARDEDTGVQVRMKHLDYNEAKRLLMIRKSEEPSVIVVRPDSKLYKLFYRIKNAS